MFDGAQRSNKGTRLDDSLSVPLTLNCFRSHIAISYDWRSRKPHSTLLRLETIQSESQTSLLGLVSKFSAAIFHHMVHLLHLLNLED